MAAKTMNQNAELFTEAYKATAKLLYRYYKELTEAGFTPDQAIKIVATHGVVPGGK